MCRGCVKQELPQRGTICLESGSYLLNFASCKECGRREPLKILDKVDEEDEDGEEMVTYKHVCPSCNHIVAKHEYTFRVDGEFQVYNTNVLRGLELVDKFLNNIYWGTLVVTQRVQARFRDT